MSDLIFFPGARRIAVVSDSHHDRSMLEQLAERLRGVQGILHLGDNIPDAVYLQQLTGLPMYNVRGNVELSSGVMELQGRLGSAEGPRFLACHGHRWDVKNGLSSLYYHALETDCPLVFYGHTHIAHELCENGVRMLNPGALRDGSYMIFTIEGQIAEWRSLRGG